MGLNVLPPDINESYFDFVPNQKGNIRFGLKAIKNVGSNSIDTIVKSRKEEGYKSFEDFLDKVDIKKINVKTLEALIKSGCFDNLGVKRSQLLVKYEDVYEKISNSKKKVNSNQTSFFDIVENEEEFFDSKIEYPQIDEIDLDIKLEQEKEFLGIYVSGHPLDDYEDKILRLTNATCNIKANGGRNLCFAGRILEVHQHYTKNNNLMAFLTVEDWDTSVDIVVFPDTYQNFKDFLHKGNVIMIVGRQSKNDSFISNNILDLKLDILEIDLKDLEVKKLNELRQFIHSKEGNNPVIFNNRNMKVITDKEFWVKLDENTINQLNDIINNQHYEIY
jgi:DNA polymerase-3 subunit alpha